MEQQSDNFSIFGCWEFELACQQSKDKQQDLNESIRDVVNNNTEIDNIDFLDQIYGNFFKSLHPDIKKDK